MEIKAEGLPPVFAQLAAVEKRHGSGPSNITRDDCLGLARNLCDQITDAIEEARQSGEEVPPPPYGFLRHALKMMIGEDSTANDRRLIATYAAIILGQELPTK